MCKFTLLLRSGHFGDLEYGDNFVSVGLFYKSFRFLQESESFILGM